jgi:hypothetical protein
MSRTQKFVPAIYQGFVDAIGNTPLIFLKGPSARTGCQIYGKAEFLNPGGSVKDRAAKFLVEGLERDGKLEPGGTIVEGTAGNTGIGLTYVANAKGYRSVIVIPRTQTAEKKDTLRQAGATLIEVDANPYRHPNNYIRLSGRLADEIPGSAWANQVGVRQTQAHDERKCAVCQIFFPITSRGRSPTCSLFHHTHTNSHGSLIIKTIAKRTWKRRRRKSWPSCRPWMPFPVPLARAARWRAVPCSFASTIPTSRLAIRIRREPPSIAISETASSRQKE